MATLDWATRKVLAHRVSISMTTDLYDEALNGSIAKQGAPETFNPDQGSQFTSTEFSMSYVELPTVRLRRTELPLPPCRLQGG